MDKSKKTKPGIEIDDWTLSEGLTVAGTFETMDNDFDIGYEQLDLGLDEEDLRKKYPALKDAHDLYKNILDMCRTREKEEDEN